MSGKVKWGILGCANIGVTKLLPAMKKGTETEIYAVASRDIEKARSVAKAHDVPVAHGSYEELLEDEDVQAVYIPLPNHLHYEWALKAIYAGKHVLCEKPFVLKSSEAKTLIETSRRSGVKVGEAFMIRNHPQWTRIKEMVSSGELGTLGAIQGVFTYFNDDPSNVRNVKKFGGGGLYDIGCYPIMASRMTLGEEPERIIITADFDENFHTDKVTSALLEFPSCTLSFVCATQLAAHESMTFLGTDRRLEVRRPFNPPEDQEASISLLEGRGTFEEGRIVNFPAVDHYTLQVDSFSRAVLEDGEVAVPVENSLAMALIYEAAFRSITSGRWEEICLS